MDNGMKKYDFTSVSQKMLEARKKLIIYEMERFKEECNDTHEFLEKRDEKLNKLREEYDIHQQLVNEGWELVSVTETYETGVTYHFKREI